LVNNRLLAYGDVIQVRKFKAINTGSVGVTFAVDNKTLEKSGFTVSPDKVPMLTGAPTHAALELTVTLQVSMYTVVILPPYTSQAKVCCLGCCSCLMLQVPVAQHYLPLAVAQHDHQKSLSKNYHCCCSTSRLAAICSEKGCRAHMHCV
jgi:hypothetical protein